MDFVFDCFFEEILETIERSGLKTRQNRQDVIDQLDSIIRGCSAGGEISFDETSRLAVEATIKYHQTAKRDNSKVCKMGKFHNVLYIALKIAWNWDVKDSNVICALLTEIYDCEKTFERLFLGVIFGSNAPYFIAGWRSDFKDQEENTRALVFFLNHACRYRLSFKIHGQNIPFIDVPIESCGKSSPMRVALQASAPDVLMILLRHGANACPPDGGSYPVIAVMDKLLEYETGSYPYQLVSCLKILLLVIPSIVFPYKPYTYGTRKEMFKKKYSTLFEQKIILPNIAFGVPKLKHLSRCTVREILRQNFQLPNGIKLLKLPRSLKRYIDLLEE